MRAFFNATVPHRRAHKQPRMYVRGQVRGRFGLACFEMPNVRTQSTQRSGPCFLRMLICLVKICEKWDEWLHVLGLGALSESLFCSERHLIRLLLPV